MLDYAPKRGSAVREGCFIRPAEFFRRARLPIHAKVCTDGLKTAASLPGGGEKIRIPRMWDTQRYSRWDQIGIPRMWDTLRYSRWDPHPYPWGDSTYPK